jgi:hypothetical protein
LNEIGLPAPLRLFIVSDLLFSLLQKRPHKLNPVFDRIAICSLTPLRLLLSSGTGWKAAGLVGKGMTELVESAAGVNTF